MEDLNKRRGEEFRREESEVLLFRLTTEIISDILSRLPIESILRCKCVCKAWHDLTRDPYFIKLQLSRANTQPPRLLFRPLGLDEGPSSTVCRLYLLDNEDCKAREIPEVPLEYGGFPLPLPLGGLYVSCTLNGLLCIAPEKALHPSLIYNPITKEYIVLPNTELNFPKYNILYHQIGLGFDPSIQKYKAIRRYLFISGGYDHYGCDVITVGEETSWRQVISPYIVVLHLSSLAPVFHQGAIYWIINKAYHPSGREYILSFDISEEVFRVICFPPSVTTPEYRTRFNFSCNLQLQILGDCLALTDYDDAQLLHVWGLKWVKYRTEILIRHNSIRIKLPRDGFYLSLCRPAVPNFFLELAGFKLGENLDLYYSIESNQNIDLKVSVIPEPYNMASCFRPSLISIKAVLLGRL